MKTLSHWALVTGLTVLLLSATPSWADTAKNVPDAASNNAKAIAIVSQWVEHLGGSEKILTLKNQKIRSSIQRWEPEQTFRPGAQPIPVATLQRTLTHELDGQRSIAEWQRDTLYPVVFGFDFREIINHEQGYVDGVDGLFSGPQAPMLATRLGSRRKQYLLSSSLALAQHALHYPERLKFKGSRSLADRKFHIISTSLLGHNVDLFIDMETGLLTRVRTLEDDAIYGDTRWEIVYRNWANVSGIPLPYEVSFIFHGKTIAHEIRQDISLDSVVEDAMFAVPAALRIPLDNADYLWGIRSSQFFGRTLVFGVPFDLNQGKAEFVDIQQIAAQVFHVRGPLHNSLIIEMADYLILADPVLYEQRSQAVIDKVSQRWPDKQIKYVVASHFHADHIGGIRTYAALGAKIIVGEETKDHYEAIFKAAHTIAVDTYQQNPVDVEIITVDADEGYTLSDGNRRVRLLAIENRHAIGMLAPYIEDAKMLFVADLYSPGAFPSPIPPQFSTWALDLADALSTMTVPVEQIVGAHGGVTDLQHFLADVELLR